jgi:ribosomal protein L29
MEGLRETSLEELDQALHELCQPLTALQCRLELGRVIGDRSSLQEAIDGGLEEAKRVCVIVARIRTWLRTQDAVAVAAGNHREIQ